MTGLGPKSKRKRDDSELRKKFAQAVSDSGFSVNELARLSHLDRSTVSAALSGRQCASVATWSAILKSAGVEIGYRLS